MKFIIIENQLINYIKEGRDSIPEDLTYEDVFKYSPEDYCEMMGYGGFNDVDDAEEYLEDLFNSEYPYGIKNVPEYPVAYRVIFAKDKKLIKNDEFGYHYTFYKDGIDDDWIGRIGGDNYDWDEYIPYVVELKLNRDDISWYWTIHNNLTYPNEFEITTKIVNPRIEVVNIIKYEDF